MENRIERWNNRWAIGTLFFLAMCNGTNADVAETESRAPSNSDAISHFVNIPPLSVAEALNLLAKQTEALILFPYDVVEFHAAKAAIGEYSIMEALDIVLQDSGLVADLSEKGVIQIRSIDNAEIKIQERNKMIHRKNFLAAAVAFIVGAGGATAKAVEADGAEGLIEEISVTGYRASLLKSQELKRNAVGTQDSIVTEDIGDFPDLNLAESLQRVPGVAITRDSGEGRNISLRGLGPNFTRTRVNGLEALFVTDSGLGSRGTNTRTRNFDFSVFASELFNRIDVHKSYDAKLDEGGLAGTVDLYTAQPFDYEDEEWHSSFSLKGLYNDSTEDTGPRFAGLLSKQWGNFGALVSVAHSKVETIEKGYYVWSWRQASFGADNVAASVDPDVADRLVNSVGADRVFVPRANNIASWGNVRERTGITAAFQWKPSDRASFDLDILQGELINDRVEHQLSSAGTNSFTGDVNRDQLLIDAAIEGDDLVFASFENLDMRTETKDSLSKSKFYQVSLTGNFEISDRLSATVLLGKSESDYDLEWNKVFLEATDHAFSVDWRDADYGQNTYDFDVADVNEWDLMRTDVAEGGMTNAYDTYQVDFEFDVDDQSTLHFGLSSKSYLSEGFERRDREDWEDDPSAPDGVFAVTAIPSLIPYVVGNNSATFDQVTATGRISLELDESYNRPGTVYDIQEDTLAAYVQYDWSSSIGGFPVRANVGARWYETDQTSSGDVITGGAVEQAVFKKTYSDFLPSVNVVFDLNDDWLLRFGANRNISRPSLDQLRAAGDVGVADQLIRAGNPNLERFVADSFGSSVEYYGENTSVSVGYFYKDMDSFIVERSQTLTYAETGYPLEFLAFDPRVSPDSEFTVTQPINGEPATVYGLELAFQTDLRFLPAPFDNLGVSANLTYADGETTFLNEGEEFEVTPPGLSELSHNLTVYYETEEWGARISNSYRSDYITGEGREQNLVAGFDETTFVDFKAFYNVSDELKVSFEAINLTDEPIRQFLDNRTHAFTQSGRNFTLGMSYSY